MTKGRWLVLVLALILAALATAGVYPYSRGVEGPKETERMGAVVISEVDIPPRTDLNELIKHDHFRLILIPEDAVVDGAVTSIGQLRDGRNRVVILAGEQIPAARIRPTNEDGGYTLTPREKQWIEASWWERSDAEQRYACASIRDGISDAELQAAARRLEEVPRSGPAEGIPTEETEALAFLRAGWAYTETELC